MMHLSKQVSRTVCSTVSRRCRHSPAAKAHLQELLQVGGLHLCPHLQTTPRERRREEPAAPRLLHNDVRVRSAFAHGGSDDAAYSTR